MSRSVSAAAVGALMWAGPALAQGPPPQYLKPFPGWKIYYVSLEQTRRMCRSTGCTFSKIQGLRGCRSYIARGLSPALHQWTLNAELAHCHGWQYPGQWVGYL